MTRMIFTPIIISSIILTSLTRQNRERPFESAFENGQVFDNGLYVDPNFGHLLTEFVPIIDTNGKTVGMVGADLSADEYSG